MLYKDLSFPEPLEYHETFDVLDASKIQTFMDSPRRFFYQYILGWKPDEPNIHFVFGSAMHEAMEYVMNNVGRYGDVNVATNAYSLFMDTYRETYPNSTYDEANYPKTPEKALEVLIKYLKSNIGDSFQTIYTEIAGTVPLTLERLLHFKLDSIILDEDGFYWSMEHKTTGNEWNWNTGTWADSWGLKPQVWGYNHALRAHYGHQARGVKINGFLVSKRRVETKRVPIRKSVEMMQSGLENLNHWVDQIDWNMQRLQEESVSNKTMFAFPCNGVSCTKYKCPFHHFCEVWPNPLQNAHRLPYNFTQEYWDPRREEAKAKKVLHLEKIEAQDAANGNLPAQTGG